ncbi:MAG: hypothetical protein Q9221_008080 [Calogaya cf. arnoldii]
MKPDMKPDMKSAFDNDDPNSPMYQQENSHPLHSDAPIPAPNLDAEKGLETPPQQEEKEAQVRQITGFKAFYINLLFAAILAPIYLFILLSFDPYPGVSVGGRLARFDFLGSLLSISAIVCLIIGINFGSVLYEWNSRSIIALFVVSGVLFIVFALKQIFKMFTIEDNRVFPVHLVRRKEPVLLFIAGSSARAAIYIALYYIPLYIQFTRGDSAIRATVRLLPFVFVLSAMVLANGFFMAKFGRYTP